MMNPRSSKITKKKKSSSSIGGMFSAPVDQEASFDPSDFFFSSKILIVVGETGMGKSYYALHHPLRAGGFYFDLENRYGAYFEDNPEISNEVEVTNCVAIRNDFSDDAIETFHNVERAIDDLFHRENRPTIVVMDGIGDLRCMCADVYCAEHGTVAVYGPGPWGEVNERCKQVIYRLINYGKAMAVPIIFTCFLTDEYDEEDNKTGYKKIDAKDFILARIDEEIQVKRNGNDYYIRRAKSARGSTNWVKWSGAI